MMADVLERVEGGERWNQRGAAGEGKIFGKRTRDHTMRSENERVSMTALAGVNEVNARGSLSLQEIDVPAVSAGVDCVEVIFMRLKF